MFLRLWWSAGGALSSSSFLSFQRLVTLLVVSLLLTSQVAAQKISPTNNLIPENPNRILQVAFGYNRADATRYQILARHPGAGLRTYESYGGVAVKLNASNTFQLDRTTVAFLPCDSNLYPDLIKPVDVLVTTVSSSPPPLAVIFYSEAQNGCDYDAGSRVDSSYSHLYTLTIPVGNSSLITNGGMVTLARKSLFDANGTDVTQGNPGATAAPGGPSPSTAVAMIILYSITGVITALFLIIIVTGAIRAHRHPERYGPRNALGRPRQSRARGLARAMLETLPIVKFGEDESKPNDVELANATTTETKSKTIRDSTISEADGDNSNSVEPTKETITGEGSEAQKPEDEVAAAVPDEALGCSICTDDFEKGQDVRVLPCNHHFHPACIDPWLLNVSGTCPLCRIDLRPAATADEAGRVTAAFEDAFPPPLDPAEQARRASRRHSLIWDILNPTRMRDASAQERIMALRRVREERRFTNADETEARRRRRVTARFHDVFSIRTTGSSWVVGGGGVGDRPINHQISRIAENPSSTTPVSSSEAPSYPPATTSDWPISRPTSQIQAAQPPITQSSAAVRPSTPASTQHLEPSTPSAIALPPSPTPSTRTPDNI